MSRHSQKVQPKHFTCTNCQNGDCMICVDVLRMVYTSVTICQCTRQGHSGEATDKQIQDPETGAVYAPGLTVEADGSVTFHENGDGKLEQ